MFSKKGEATTVPITAILEIILSILGVIVAVFIIIGFYNVLLGSDAGDIKYAKESLELLHSKIKQGNEDTFYLNLDSSYFIIAYDKPNEKVEFKNPIKGKNYMYSKDCEGSCVCLYANEDSIVNNFLIPRMCLDFDREYNFFGTDLLAANNGKEKVNYFKDDILKYGNKYTHLVIGQGKEETNYKNQKLIIYKDDNKILITDAIYKNLIQEFGKCNNKEGDCRDKTEYQLFKNYYCEYDKDTSSCKKKTATLCKDGSIIDPCLCGGELKLFGACKSSKFYAINCNYINSCEDYTGFEDNYCTDNICSITDLNCELKDNICVKAK